jgi:hypothetical protein
LEWESLISRLSCPQLFGKSGVESKYCLPAVTKHAPQLLAPGDISATWSDVIYPSSSSVISNRTNEN